LGEVEVDEALVPSRLGDRLRVLTAGRAHEDEAVLGVVPPERLQDLVGGLGRLADVAVVASPPPHDLPDVLEVAGSVDAVLLALLATGLAIPFSALAVASPPVALGAAAGLGFVATAFVNISAGVAVFAALTFFALIPGVGTSFVSVVKLAGAVILLALGRRQGGRTLWRDQPLLASIATAL